MKPLANPKPCRVCGRLVMFRHGLTTRVHRSCKAEADKKAAMFRHIHASPRYSFDGACKAVGGAMEKARPAYKLTRVPKVGTTVPNLDIAKGNHRSQALRDSAKGEACVACGRNDGTTVWAHSNEGAHGKGKSLKSHDLLGNYFCFDCHNFYDSGTASRAVKQAFFREAYVKTMVRVAEKLASGALKL